MYIDPRFFDLYPGSIGVITYRKDMCMHLTDAEKQAYVSKAANERMRMFINNAMYGMTGNGPVDPAKAYMDARKDSWGDLEDGQAGTTLMEVVVQVGQQESYDLIIKIESMPDFRGWTNQVFVDMIKEQYKDENTSS